MTSTHQLLELVLTSCCTVWCTPVRTCFTGCFHLSCTLNNSGSSVVQQMTSGWEGWAVSRGVYTCMMDETCQLKPTASCCPPKQKRSVLKVSSGCLLVFLFPTGFSGSYNRSFSRAPDKVLRRNVIMGTVGPCWSSWLLKVNMLVNLLLCCEDEGLELLNKSANIRRGPVSKTWQETSGCEVSLKGKRKGSRSCHFMLLSDVSAHLL